MNRNWILPGVFLALILGLWTVVGPIGASRAYAQCSSGCGSPPPSCNCTPAPPTPPSPPCNCTPSVRVPGVRVYVSPSVVVNASASANVNASASASGQGSGQGAVIVGGGASAWGYASPGAVNYVQGLNVQTGVAKSQKVAFQNTRSKTSRIVVRASCLDDKDVPHPASQVIPDKIVDDTYEGEIFRCIAGTTIQYVYGDYSGSDQFQGGTTVVCNKGDAIWYSAAKSSASASASRTSASSSRSSTGSASASASSASASSSSASASSASASAASGGSISCRPQIPARDCNERSLLRRFGAGVKVVDVTLTESYTDYREETVSEESSSTSNLTLDGGVGGYTY